MFPFPDREKIQKIIAKKLEEEPNISKWDIKSQKLIALDVLYGCYPSWLCDIFFWSSIIAMIMIVRMLIEFIFY